MSSAERRAGSLAVVRRGLVHSPEILHGIWFTVALSIIATAGGTVVPILVRHVIDTGLTGTQELDPARVHRLVLLALLVIVIIALTSFWSKVRIFTAAEAGLSTLRVKAFRHVHDLSMLTQNTQRRGALVSRVTSDVDQVSQFLQFAGMMLIVSSGQMVVATIVMATMSWQLTIVVLVCFLPLVLSLRLLAATMARAYDRVRVSIGDMLSAISEPVVGAAVVRSFGIQERTLERIGETVHHNYRLNVRAQTVTAGAFGSAIVVGGLANGMVVVVGTWLGITGSISLGTLIAFIFLIGLFTGPAQMATQVIADSQNAIASWRRVIELLDQEVDVVDPGSRGEKLADSRQIEVDRVDFAYPGGPLVLHDVDVTIPERQRVAVVGETGSGKTTFAKLITRLMDPTTGQVRLGGVSLDRVRASDLRKAVLMVPQEGFLFDASLADNLRYGKPDASDSELLAAIDSLGLRDWFNSLGAGLATPVGQRGESLSAGERQLVALVRSALANPDVLVLDEATSAVDPQTELRATRALDVLLAGRTSVTIAHRLSTAENADRILVFDHGRLVEDGPHAQLVNAGGVYSRLHASWVAQSRLAQ